ncbi:MAG: ComF family protein [Pseudomonadota bacterium]
MNIWSLFDPFRPDCLICGLPTRQRDRPCPGCRYDLPRLPAGLPQLAGPDHVLAACAYAFPVDRLILQLKFGGRLPVARTLGLLLADAARHADRPDLLLPVPLHPSRERERGFNQAQAIAQVAGRELGIPVQPRALQRLRATPAQSGLDLEHRRCNLRGAFAVGMPLPAHVALIDDVITTGSTARELAGLLHGHGVRRVAVWAVARTL